MMPMSAIDTARLYELLASELRGRFRRRGFSEQDAEDLTQEVFLRVHRSRDEVVETERIPAWIWRIAHNVMVDETRRSKTRPMLHEDPDHEDPGQAEQGADGSVSKLAVGWLRSAIDALPAEDAAILERSELAGQPHRKIASDLGLGLSAVKSRVTRGRAKLRSALFECCRFEFDRRGGIVDHQRKGPCTDDGCCD